MHYLFLVGYMLAASAQGASPVTLVQDAKKVQFRYQENSTPWDVLDCTHERSENPLDWLVSCGPDGQKQFRVHLKLSYYKRTVYGKSGYELLYWLTQIRGATEAQKYNSTTLWIHHTEATEASVIEAATGVEGDQAVLRLFVRL